MNEKNEPEEVVLQLLIEDWKLDKVPHILCMFCVYFSQVDYSVFYFKYDCLLFTSVPFAITITIINHKNT